MISVVMSVFNEDLSMIKKAIDSMLNQTYQGEIELIVVIDNPNNREMVDFLMDYEKTFTSIKLLKNKKNRGLAYSLNRGISYAKGDYICRMDADDISLPERIEKELDFLLRNNLDFVSSQAIPINEKDEVIEKKLKVPLTQNDISRVIKYSGCLIHPTWFFTKKSWSEIGGYRESLVASQDYDYSIRMVNGGYRIATIENPLLYYRIRENAISVSKRSLQTFLGLYAQNNVYRNKPFDDNIIRKIQSNECIEYNLFTEAFNNFYNCRNKFYKLLRLAEGCVKSKFFKRYVYNNLMLRFIRL